MKKIKLTKNSVKKAEGTDKPKKKLKVKSGVWATLLVIGIGGVTLVLVFALYIIITAPEFNRDKLYSKEATVIYYADGSEMTRYGDRNRVLVTYDDLPQVLIDAIVATEDSRFFQHTGLDVARFAKAIMGQLVGNDKAGGASTISMQVIKQDYTSSEKEGLEGIIRKFTDIYMSIFKLESNYTKEEIMEFYVNTMWFSTQNNIYIEGGIAGVEQASQYFFGKSVSDLNLAEASVLAGMFQNPVQYDPYKKVENTTKRQNTVLTLMVQHGYITEQEKEDAQKISISSLLVDHSQDSGNSATANKAIIDYVISEVTSETKDNPYSVPMKIYTTINPKVQNVLNNLEIGEIYKWKKDELEEGIAITSTEDGSIVALSGGRKYNDGAHGTNHATGIKRQPGSTAKILFDYGPYLEVFKDASPYTLFLDAPHTYSNGRPIHNANSGSYSGLVSMRTALVNSLNIPALRAFQAVNKEDPEFIGNFVHSLGIDYGDTLFEASAIGGFDGVSPLQMSAAYAAYGRGGYYIEPYIFTKVEYIETGKTYEHKYEKKQVMSEETAYMITDMLISAAKSGVGGVSVSGTDIAAKSGTNNLDSKTIQDKKIPVSKANSDAWNITYDPEYCIALWIGFDSVSKTQYLTSNTGGAWRKEIMREVGKRVYSKNKKFSYPSSLISVTVEKETFPAQLASNYTPSDMKTTEYFREGAQPQEVSSRYDKLENPTNGNGNFNGTSVTLTWNAIKTPDAINPAYLTEHFNTYYDEHANEYYQKRIAYNNTYIGTLGYQIYRKELDNTLTYLGRTEATSFIDNSPQPGTNNYVIKSTYSRFTANASDGLNISVNANIETNVNDLVNSSQTTDDGTSDNNNDLNP